MTECCPCIKYRERGQSRERMAPVRGPGRSGRKPLGPTRPGCSASREIGGTSAECSALGPLRGPLRATVRPSVVPLRASARPGFLLPRSFAGAGGGRRGSVGPGRPSAPFGSLRWPRATAAPPAPVARFRAPPPRPVPCASCGPRAPGAGPWWGGSALACSVLPVVALRGSAASPVPPLAPRGSPLRSTPCGGRPPGVRAPPAGRGWPGASRPAFRLRPARRWESATVRPARQGSSPAAKGRPCLAVLPAACGR